LYLATAIYEHNDQTGKKSTVYIQSQNMLAWFIDWWWWWWLIDGHEDEDEDEQVAVDGLWKYRQNRKRDQGQYKV